MPPDIGREGERENRRAKQDMNGTRTKTKKNNVVMAVDTTISMVTLLLIYTWYTST